MSKFPLKPTTFFYAVSLVFLLAACGSGEETIPKNVKPVQLEFFETYTFEELRVNWEIACMQQERLDSSDTTGKSVPMDQISKNRLRNLVDFSNTVVISSQFGMVAKSDREKVSQLLNKTEIRSNFPDDVEFLWALDPEEGTDKYVLYAVKIPPGGKAQISGKDLKDVEMVSDNYSGSPALNVTMTKKGALKWELMTGRNLNKALAICIDRKVVICPIVNSVITGGNLQISGNFTVQEAEDLVMGIKAGKR